MDIDGAKSKKVADQLDKIATRERNARVLREAKAREIEQAVVNARKEAEKNEKERAEKRLELEQKGGRYRGVTLNKVTCQGCGSVLRYDQSKLPEGKVKGKCKKCGNKILLNNHQKKDIPKPADRSPSSLTKCSYCNSDLSADAEECKLCNVVIARYLESQSRTKKCTLRREQSDNSVNYKEIETDSSIFMKKNQLWVTVGLLFLLFVYFFSQQESDSRFAANTSTSETSGPASLPCYYQGYRYGKCGAYVLANQKCPPEFDIVISPACRNDSAVERGIVDGMKEVKDEL